jgi:protein-S-isoprenylcysteine O-methyltransferase Ste14
MPTEAIFRIVYLLLLVASVAISGYYRRRARLATGTIPRRAEGGTALLLRMLGALILAGSYLAYVFVPGVLEFARIGLPGWARWLAAALAVGGLFALRWVFTSIGSNISETVLTKERHQLVTHGPYRWIRHPLYAFALLQFVLLALIADNGYLLLLPCVAVVLFALVVIPREEENLTVAFGDEYRSYMNRTGALFPRVLRRGDATLGSR